MDRRARSLNALPPRSGPVIYWMSRDQRTKDNWALLFAQQQALLLKQPLIVVFCLQPSFLEAGMRQYDFMLQGLENMEKSLMAHNIPLIVLSGEAAAVLPPFLLTSDAGVVVTDFDPLNCKQKWKKEVLARITAACYEVDAHNVVPCWLASPKQEYGAYTLRPKIHKLLPQYLTDIPSLLPHPFSWPEGQRVDWHKVRSSLQLDSTVAPVSWLTAGEEAAAKGLDGFIARKLASYDEKRNDPSLDGTSRLSPYLHFGHLAPQRVALAVLRSDCPPAAREAYLEELIVRRELADNYCYYNPAYATLPGSPAWSQTTLHQHRHDHRTYLYSLAVLDGSGTHDDLWNAAQRQLVSTGIMHGYLRMYWAKKLLEWTPEPEEALRIAIHLNDKYALDGRDPNGYTGIAWSICGVHDRPWFERPIFGKIRYMSYNGCKGKFDIKAYIRQYGVAENKPLFEIE